MKTIATDQAPAAIGPYSQAVDTGTMVFLSGQLGIDPITKTLAHGMEQQAEQVFTNVRSVLAAAGLSLSHVVKTTVFLSDMHNFPVMNEIYARQFGGHKPARSTIEVARLPLDALVEIECVAVREE